MREWHIKDKVIKFAGRFKGNSGSAKREMDRKLSIVANRISQEYTERNIAMERHMIEFIHHVIKEELS